MRDWPPIARYTASAGAVAVVTIGFAPFADEINHTTVALGYLLAVLFVATLFGSRLALVASIAAALCFNFFFLPPYYTFVVAQGENWVALGAFLITALVAGQLSSYARRRADEVERLYKELQAAFEQASDAEALRRSEKLKSALLDAVSHDLRTPLTSIKAAATTLMENDVRLDKATRGELLQVIDEETDRLNGFIGGLVDVARVEAGRLETRYVDIPVADLISGATTRSASRCADHELVIDMDKDLPYVRVDGSSAEEVIYCLLDNAAKYSEAGKKIRIKATAVDDAVEIAVDDQGRGIAEQDRERIFNKFVRVADNGIHTTASGLGLGLAIARGLAESQGGSLTVRDGDDGYVTSFVLALPIAQKEAVR